MALDLLVDDKSTPFFLPELAFFDTAKTVTEIEKATFVKLNPLASLTNATVLEWQYTGTDENVADLANSLLLLDVQMTEEDGTLITTDINVVPECGILHALFSNADFYIENQLVESFGNLFPYLHYFQVGTNYNVEASHAHFGGAGYQLDSPGEMENRALEGWAKPAAAAPTTTGGGTGGDAKNQPDTYKLHETNHSYNIRRARFAKSKVVKLVGPLLMALFVQRKYLIQRTDFKLRLTRSKPEFYLRQGDDVTKNYILKILKAELWIPQMKLTGTRQASVEMGWRASEAKYPLLRPFMSYHTLSADHINVSLPNLINGSLPVKMMMGLIDSEAFAGSKTKNCFNFQHFDLERLLVSINSEPVFGMPLEMDYENNDYVMAYNSIHMSNGTFKKNISNFITYFAFKNGYCIYNISLTPHVISANGIAYGRIKTGTLQLDLKFRTPPKKPIVMILKFIFNNQVSITYEKAVTFNYSA
jgi:hypothetical protein